MEVDEGLDSSHFLINDISKYLIEYEDTNIRMIMMPQQNRLLPMIVQLRYLQSELSDIW